MSATDAHVKVFYVLEKKKEFNKKVISVFSYNMGCLSSRNQALVPNYNSKFIILVLLFFISVKTYLLQCFITIIKTSTKRSFHS